MQFMFDGMPTTHTGSYTRTHVAIASALRSSKADNGYSSEAFTKFLDYIPSDNAAYRVALCLSTTYPDAGFISDTPLAV